MDVPWVERPSRINAARKAVRAVAKLDELLDHLRPSDMESHPESRQGLAWASLVGCVARATLRADEVLDAETPLKMADTWNDGKRGACFVRDLKKGASRNGTANGHAANGSLVLVEGTAFCVKRRIEGTNLYELEKAL